MSEQDDKKIAENHASSMRVLLAQVCTLINNARNESSMVIDFALGPDEHGHTVIKTLMVTKIVKLVG